MTRYFFIFGCIWLAIFFALAKQKVHGWQPIAFVSLWLLLIGIFSFASSKLSRRCLPDKPYSIRGVVHAAFRTLPPAILFSPTLVNFYMFAFPAPASLTILGFIFFGDKKQMQGLYSRNILTAMVCFLSFWLIIWAINYIWHSEKLSTAKPLVRAIRYLCFFAIAATSVCLAAHWLYHAPLLSSETSNFSMADANDEQRYIEWCDEFPRYIIPRMCDYYKLHPESFKPTGKGEEIEVEGFAAFVKNDDYFKNGHLASVKWGKIRDPWGEPVGFVEDLNMDGYIDVAGERQIVLKLGAPGKSEGLNAEHHFGIYKRSHFNGPNGKPWERIFAETF